MYSVTTKGLPCPHEKQDFILTHESNIHRQIRNLSVCTNILICEFNKCLFMVIHSLFRSYCLSMYDIALWHEYTLTCSNKLRSCYRNKCIKLFVGYHRRHSLTQVLMATSLPSFDTVMHNSAHISARLWQNCPNVCINVVFNN